jgi:hypothetical protein
MLSRWPHDDYANALTWPPQHSGAHYAASHYAGCSPLLGVTGYSHIGGSSIWAPRDGETSAGSPSACSSDTIETSSPVRHIIAELLLSSSSSSASSPTTMQTSPSRSAQSQASVAAASSCSSQAHSSDASVWNPSPAVGQNPNPNPDPNSTQRYFSSDTAADDADESADESAHRMGALPCLGSRAGAVDKRMDACHECASDGEDGGQEDEHASVGIRELELAASRDAVHEALEAAMQSAQVPSTSAARVLSRDLRMKMAMRSVLEAERLVRKGVVVASKSGRGRKDKRSDHSSTESDACPPKRKPEATVRHSLPAKSAKAYAPSSMHEHAATCAQRALWAMFGALLTAGSALVFVWASSDSALPLSML